MRRATSSKIGKVLLIRISIHALREEGDLDQIYHVLHDKISIHALREEGDIGINALPVRAYVFLSTPSVRRATSDSTNDR